MLDHELEWLAYMASQSNNILEIGAWKGRTTKVLCDNTPGKVITIDDFLGDPNRPEEHINYINSGIEDSDIEEIFRENLKDHLKSGKLILVKGDSNVVKLPRTNFDFIFIDGGHHYTVAFGDILRAMNLIKSKGIISGHDKEKEGVSRATKELLGEVSSGPGTIWYKIYNQ